MSTLPPAPGAGSAPSGKDWTEQATAAVESLVVTVKQKTTVPITTATRAVVYGLVIAALGTLVLTVLAVAGVRFLTVYLPVGRVHGHHRVWAADLLLGLIFTLAGLLCWSRRTSREPA